LGRPGAGATSSSKPKEVKITQEDGKTIIDAGGGNDKIKVSQLADGRLRVTTNGESIDLDRQASQNLVIRGGRGDDEIEADASVTQAITIDGGRGNDRITGGSGNDTLIGGKGKDVIRGGAGDDRLEGGEGNDTLLGGRGNDILDGGKGNDKLLGGEGNDVLRGGLGHDYLDGGEGDDELHGGPADDKKGKDVLYGMDGDDRLYAGGGQTYLDGGRGNDALYGGAGDDILFGGASGSDSIDRGAGKNVVLGTGAATGSPPPGHSIRIEGSPEFRARVEADLAALRAMPLGRQLLEDLDRSGKSVAIREGAGKSSQEPTDRSRKEDPYLKPDGTRGSGTDSTVSYDADLALLGKGPKDWTVHPPIISLVHELIHAHDTVYGTKPRGQVKTPESSQHLMNSELAVTGLPYDADGDGSLDQNTRKYTENKFRELMNLPRRPRYSYPGSDREYNNSIDPELLY
jgi:Ca2+-binding RTX toxin-like protein